jgi:hypothetical protein
MEMQSNRRLQRKDVRSEAVFLMFRFIAWVSPTKPKLSFDERAPTTKP